MAADDRASSAATRRERELEVALRRILAVRLDTTLGVSLERAFYRARVEMRSIAQEAVGRVED